MSDHKFVPRATVTPFLAKVDESYTPYGGSTFTLVVAWQDRSNNQPLVIPMGADPSRLAVLSAMQDYIQKELVKEVLGS